MGSQLISPNLHVALVHIPIGLLVIGVLIEVFSFLYRNSPARLAARWMIALGALSMVPTAFSGIYALSDVARRSMPAGEEVDVPWADVLARTDLYHAKTGPDDAEGDQWRMISGHVWRAAPATVLILLIVLVYIGSGDVWRRRLYLPAGILLVLSVGVLLWGAWMAGEAVYRHGTAVKLDERRIGPAILNPTTAPGAAREMTEVRTARSLTYYVPPLQTHLFVAGIAVALALGATALAFRNTAATPLPPTTEEEERLLSSQVEPGVRPASPHDLAMLRSFKPAATVVITPEKSPAGRVWLLAALFALATSSLGFWFLTIQTDAWERARQDNRPLPMVLWETIKTPAPSRDIAARPADDVFNLNRRLAHVVAGGAIILLPLLMAALSRWAPKRRFVLVIFTVLLLSAIGVQLWLGLLMTFDTPAGSITKFNPPALNPMVR